MAAIVPAKAAQFIDVIRGGPDHLFEIRVLGIPGRGKPHQASGYFDDSAAALKAISVYELPNRPGPSGVYMTLNPPNRALLARANNHIKDYLEPVTAE